MRLADDINVELGGGALRLRPTLGAAVCLERRHGGFERLLGAVFDGNLTVIRDIIRETATDPRLAVLELSTLTASSLRGALDAAVAPAAEVVLALAGVDPDAQPEAPSPDPKPVSFEDFHTRLFEIGTGWLGWTPEATWNATPAEILAAYRGRTDMLAAIFGTSKDAESGPSSLPTEAERAESIAKLRELSGCAQRKQQ